MNRALGDNAMEFIDSFLTPEEIAESNLRVAIIDEIIRARQEKNMTQRDVEALSGVKQPVIARMEKGSTDPKLHTILKILLPLGKTLAVVPIEQKTATV